MTSIQGDNLALQARRENRLSLGDCFLAAAGIAAGAASASANSRAFTSTACRAGAGSSPLVLILWLRLRVKINGCTAAAAPQIAKIHDDAVCRTAAFQRKYLVIILSHAAFHHNPYRRGIMLGNPDRLGKTAVYRSRLFQVRRNPGILYIHHNALGIGQNADLVGCFLGAIQHDACLVSTAANPDSLDFRHGTGTLRKACRLGLSRSEYEHKTSDKQHCLPEQAQPRSFFAILHLSIPPDILNASTAALQADCHKAAVQIADSYSMLFKNAMVLS